MLLSVESSEPGGKGQPSEVKVNGRWNCETMKIEVFGGGGRRGRRRFHLFVLPATTSYWDVPQGATVGPVPPARLAEVPGLS